MLGRLGLTIKECKQVYYDLSKDIFNAGTWAQVWSASGNGSRYKADDLENSIKRVVREHATSRSEDEPMLDPQSNACKV
jgi:hypothetical protein